jgi:hypothetical protein
MVRLLWGEAAYRERQEESCYLTGEALRLALIAQGERYAGDTNHDALSDALEGKEGFIPTRALFDVCEITDDHARQSHATTKSISNAMTKLGWIPLRRRLKQGDKVGNPVRGWGKGDVPEGALTGWWEWEIADRSLKHVLRVAA